MAHTVRSGVDWLSLVVAAVAGAAAMYVLDPEQGRRRRAIARERLGSVTRRGAVFAGAAARDAAHRMRGLEAEAKRRLTIAATPDDLQLIERVRAALGRVVSHAHAIQVGASRGRIMLSGPVLAAEVAGLLDAVRSVAGVSEVDNHLVVHQESGSIPSLQSDPRHARPLPAHAGTRWTPALRAAALVTGSTVALYGLARRTPVAIGLAGIGFGLAARGAADRPIARLLACRPLRRTQAQSPSPPIG